MGQKRSHHVLIYFRSYIRRLEKAGFFIKRKEWMMLRSVLLAIVIISFAGNCFAAVAGNTSDPKIPYGKGAANMQASGMGPLKVSFDGEFVFDKDLEGPSGVSNADIHGQWYLARIGYNFADRVEPYVKIGMSHLTAGWDQGGSNIKVKSENDYALGGGVKVLMFEVPEHRLRFSLDGQYIYTDPGVDKAQVDIPNRTITASEFTVTEWQITGIVSMEFPLNYDRRNKASIYSVIPYLGLAYVDSSNDIGFTFAGTQ